MPQGLQQPGVSQQQLLKAHTLRQDIFFLKAEQAENTGRNQPVEAAQDGTGKERSEEQSVCL